MVTIIDLRQPAILRALNSLDHGECLRLAEVMGGARVWVDHDRLMIDDGEPCEIVVEIGED